MEALQKAARLFRGVFGTFDTTPAEAEAVTQDLLTDDFWTLNKPAPDAAAGDLYTLGALKVPWDMSVEELVVIPGGALVASDTANGVLTLAKADGLGGAATPVATLTTNLASGNWATEVLKNGSLAAYPAKQLLKGQLLTLKKAITGAGVVVPACSIYIRLRRN